jgi:imidazolonepropionase-like amidohydrolase
VGENLQAEGAQVYDAAGLVVTPGIIDAHCHIGIMEDGVGFEGDDVNEVINPVTANLRALDAVNPEDPSFAEAREAGVTTVCTGPGSANVIGGQFLAMKTVGRRVDDMVIKEPLALKIAFGENPKRCYSELKKSPSTRMATAAILREALVAAQEYQKKLDMSRFDNEGNSKQPDRDLSKEVLCDALDGRLMVKAHCHRADDILTALRISKEFHLNMSIEHCTEGYRIVDILKDEEAKVILGPLLSTRSKIELNKMSFKAPAVFAQAGMKFAIMTDHPVIPIQYLPVCAALAVREGLDEMEALRAITIYAAQITGIDERVGSLEPGKDADIVVWTGHPLDYRTKTRAVFIDGAAIYKAP